MRKNSWADEIVTVLKYLGGEGNLEDLYLVIEKRNKKKRTAKWKTTVRATIYDFSSDSDGYQGREDLFYAVSEIGGGEWGLRNFDPSENNVALTDDETGYPEGIEKLRLHIYKERNPKVIREAKQKYIEKHGKITCEICKFDFGEVYGSIGNDYAEGHHLKPIATISPGHITKIEDIAIVCANCHRILHKYGETLEREQLKSILMKSK